MPSKHIPPNKRLIDYYFVVTASDRAKTGTIQRLANEPLAQRGAVKPAHATFAWKPKIVDRYPARDHLDTPLRAWVARSSLPRGVRARTRPPPPRFATFVGWNVDGCKLYGAVIEVFEKLRIPNQNENVYMPKVLGFLSHYPFFYSFEVFLRCLWYGIPKDIIRLEDLLVHYFYHIPVPAPGQKIAYDFSGGPQKVLVTQRNEFDIPIPELPQDILFSRLSEDRICWIICHLLSSHRVIFVASQESELPIATETFSSLLFPLRWTYLYVPIASKHVALSLYKYNGPFMVGIPLFLYKRDEVKSRLPRDTYVVELDHNRVLGPMDANGRRQVVAGPPEPTIPSVMMPELRKGIHALSRILTMPMDEMNVRRSRSQILVALRACFNVVRYTIAHCHAYHEQSPIQHSREEERFFELFGETQMYKKFSRYYRRVNPDDTQFRKIYQFFKRHEALGKDFARPVSAKMRVAFDRKVYSTKHFVVDKKLVARLEKPFTSVSSTPSPPGSPPVDQTQEQDPRKLSVPSNGEVATPMKRKITKKARKRTQSRGAAAAATPVGDDDGEEPTFSVRTEKRVQLIPPEFVPDISVMGFLNDHMIGVHVAKIHRSNPTSKRSTPMRLTGTMALNNLTKLNSDPANCLDEAAEMDDHLVLRLPEHIENKDGFDDEFDPSELSIAITRNASSRSSSVYDDGEIVISEDHLEHFDEMRGREFSDVSDWSLSEESGPELDDLEDWETESALSDVGSVGSASKRRGHRGSTGSVRGIHRFRHLNEFELSDEEKKGLRMSQQDHNAKVLRVPVDSFANIVGGDLFTKEILDAWTRHASGTTRSPKRRGGGSR